jgi:hypothetical protein
MRIPENRRYTLNTHKKEAPLPAKYKGASRSNTVSVRMSDND